MEIKKIFTIDKIVASKRSNAPFTIVILGLPYLSEKSESTLTLDSRECERFGIPMSLDIVGKKLLIKLKSRSLHVQTTGNFSGFIDRSSIDSTHLLINNLRWIEEQTPMYSVKPPRITRRNYYTLELETAHMGGTHFSPSPCPYYKLKISLSDEECGQCRILPVETVFEISLEMFNEQTQP